MQDNPKRPADCLAKYFADLDGAIPANPLRGREKKNIRVSSGMLFRSVATRKEKSIGVRRDTLHS